ncbi:unnamed protein product [Diamesa tonsa]
MNVAVDSQWNRENSNFVMDNNDYEKAFENYISDDNEFDENNEYPDMYQSGHAPEDDQQLDEIFIDIPPSNVRLHQCPVCSRKFNHESLLKHVEICEKINTKTRKPFDSTGQRLKGTEFTAVSAAAANIAGSRQAISKFDNYRASPPKTLQRKASETSLKSQPTTSAERRTLFDNMNRKYSTISLGTPRPVVKKTMQQQNEKCPHCERVFGYKAFDRHVEWCKEKALIKGNPDCPVVSAAKERLNIRKNYRAPGLKTKRGVAREKYSPSCNGSQNSLADFDSHMNSMSSSMTSENGLYDPFLSAKKQLEELFSPTTSTPTTQMINSMMTTPTSNSSNLMSKSMIYTTPIVSPKTPQPIPKMNTFKRTSSLRVSNRKTKPIYIEKSVSNIQRGISDEGPISPNFMKAIDYDELPIKSPYSAIKMVEATMKQTSPSPVMPSIIHKPVMRDKSSTSLRKNLTLELKNPNKPSETIPISKTDSMALFLKYESDLSAQLSEKELKDKSNSLSKRTLIMNHNGSYNNDKDHKLPDINGKLMPKLAPINTNNNSNELGDERPLISIDNFNKSTMEKKPISVSNGSYLAPLKMINNCDNLPAFNNNNTSRSPSIDRKMMLDDESRDSSSSQNSRRSATTLRRKVKLSKDNFLFDTGMDTDAKSQPSSSDDSNNNSLKRPESRNSKSESVFDDFDFDQFLSTFNDDDKYPIFKDYKKLLNRPTNNDEEQSPPISNKLPNFKEVSPNSKPIQIQQSEAEMSGVEKLDNLCKMLSNPSDSDESNSLETDPIERNTARSKSSADSAYGSVEDSADAKLSKFCHECGYKFIVPTAKFCIECGVRRIKL